MNIYWDIPNHELVKSTTNQQTVQKLTLVLRDQVPIALYPVQENTGDGDAYVAYTLPTGYTVKCSMKASTGLAGQPLAFQGDWGALDSDHYDATLSLNTAALVAAVGDETSLAVMLELTLQDASGNNRDSTQVNVTILADVHRPTDAAPTSLSPLFKEYTDETTGKKCIRIMNSDGEVLAEYKPAGV